MNRLIPCLGLGFFMSFATLMAFLLITPLKLCFKPHDAMVTSFFVGLSFYMTAFLIGEVVRYVIREEKSR